MRRVMLSRFVQASTAALIVLVLAGAVRADTIKEFDVSGTALNSSGGQLGTCAAGETCSFSGTMTVAVTSSPQFPRGTVTAYDITFPGLPAFDICCSFNAPAAGNVWGADSDRNSTGDRLVLDFTTTHTPASLVGFDGGSIVGITVREFSSDLLYSDLQGSITPAANVIPEPGTLGLLGTGLIGLAGVARRKLKLWT